MVPEGSTTGDDKTGKWERYSPESRKIITSKARDQYPGILLFLMNANDKKYAIYRQDLHNTMTKGRNEYPTTTLIEAQSALEDFKFNPKLYQVERGNERTTRTQRTRL